MKSASASLIQHLYTNDQFLMADLWTIVTKSGVTLRYTDYDKDLTVSGNTFSSKNAIISGGTYRLVKGIEVDEMELQFTPNPSAGQTVSGMPLLQAVVLGLFTRATVKRERLFMPTAGSEALGTVVLFYGEIMDIEVDRITANLKVKSLTHLLDVKMPRRQYQARCPYTFGDSNCGVNKATYTATSTANSGTTGKVVLCNLSQAYNYFNLGVLTFTSGKNAGISRTVKQWAPYAATLTAPFPNVPQAGDAFTIVAGCSKAISADNATPFPSVSDSVDLITPSASVFYSNLGRLIPAGAYVYFKTGANAGAAHSNRQISSTSGGIVSLSTPLYAAPAIGDVFYIWQIVGKNVAQLTGDLSVVQQNSTTQVPCSSLNYPAGFFNGYSLKFTSGNNIGQTRQIVNWQPRIASVGTAFPFLPQSGDTFAINPPAVSTSAGQTCAGYGNSSRFGGFPYVPVPETAY